MNKYYTMSAQLDEKQRQQAILITAGFAGLMIIIMFLLKWDFPTIEKIAQDPGIEVELNLPEEPPVPETQDDGGGGGGNPVQAAGPAGIAPETPPAPGDPDDSKDLEEDEKSEAPPITKPPVVKKEATKITNKSIAKAEPKPVEVPAPPRPKAVLGKTTTGTGKGGGTVEDYDRAGAGAGAGAAVVAAAGSVLAGAAGVCAWVEKARARPTAASAVDSGNCGNIGVLREVDRETDGSGRELAPAPSIIP